MTVRVVVRKGNNAINSVYAGEVGELTYDSDNKTIRIHDGTTLGGTKAVTTNSNGELISTINVANITSLSSNTANITSLISNTANISTANITSLISNTANITSLISNTANISTANITSLISNTANITSLISNTANISTANITSLVSNNITVANEPLSNTQVANKLYVDKKFRLTIALSGV